jgi:hypothetical protein
MIEKKIFKKIIEKLKNRYFIYEQSLRTNKFSLFFLLKDKNKKLFGEASYNSSFMLKNESVESLSLDFEDKKIYIRLFNANKTNSKKITDIFNNLVPTIINQSMSVGYGDRIGIAAPIHADISKKYNFFPLFAQQSVREITKTGKTCEDVFHNAVLGAFQSGFTEKWGADADHIRNEKWLKIMLNNKYLPYTMFTIDTFDYVVLDDVTFANNIEKDEEFKKRYNKSKKYIGKKYNFSGYSVSFTEDNIYLLVKRYYRSLSFLKKCFDLIKEKTSVFDFEPTFDEKDIDTKPEDHFYLASEMINDDIVFTTIAPKFPGIFEKGIDYIGNINDFILQLKAHKAIIKSLGNYRISLHSADDKFKIFKPFKKIMGDKFHIKTSGTTWMESLRTIAQTNTDLFKLILDLTVSKAEENSKAYYIKLDYKKINDLLKSKIFEDLIDIKESRQLLHVSYGTIIKKYRNIITEVLLLNEDRYFKNIENNYKKHFEAILT